jgi:hypothetical protein
MRSCKNRKVTQAKKRQLDILCLCNLCFFKDSILIEHNDPHLKFSNCISITFDMQKKDEKNNTVMQMLSGCQHVPGQDGSSHHPQNQILQRNKQQHPHICLLAIQQNQPRHIQTSNSGYERSHSSHWQRRTTYQERRDWHALDQIGRGNGHVLMWLLSLPHHDDWSLVQQRLFTIHPKTGQTIQPQRFQKNDQTHVLLAHPIVHNSFSFPPRPKPRKQPQQCQDKKERRWQHDLTSQASPLCAL